MLPSPLLFVRARWVLNRRGGFSSREHNVVEIHARRAGDVELFHQLEVEDAKSRPGQIHFVADRQPERERRELESNRIPRIKPSGEQDIDIEITESFDAERLGWHLTIAGGSIAETLQTEALSVKRPDVEAVELVWIPEVLSLEAGREIRRVEMRTLEIASRCANLYRPKRFDQERLLDKTRISSAVARLER